jgi:hypothetical protein
MDARKQRLRADHGTLDTRSLDGTWNGAATDIDDHVGIHEDARHAGFHACDVVLPDLVRPSRLELGRP